MRDVVVSTNHSRTSALAQVQLERDSCRVARIPSPAAALVGSRRATPQGRDNARHFAQVLGRAGVTVVSGLAAGIDAAAHEGALETPGRTCAVVGTGADIVYPKSWASFAAMEKRTDLYGKNDFDGIKSLEKDLLALRRREGVKHQNPSAQSRVRPGDRLRMVSMPASRPAHMPQSPGAAGIPPETQA